MTEKNLGTTDFVTVHVLVRNEEGPELAMLERMSNLGYEPFMGTDGDHNKHMDYIIYSFHFRNEKMFAELAGMLMRREILQYTMTHQDLPRLWGRQEELLLHQCDKGDIVRPWNGGQYIVGDIVEDSPNRYVYTDTSTFHFPLNFPVTRTQTAMEVLTRHIRLGV